MLKEFEYVRNYTFVFVKNAIVFCTDTQNLICTLYIDTIFYNVRLSNNLAVHRLDCVIVAVDLCKVHIVLIVIPVT